MPEYEVRIRVNERGEARIVDGAGGVSGPAPTGGMPAPAAEKKDRTTREEAQDIVERNIRRDEVMRYVREIEGPGPSGVRGQLMGGIGRIANTMFDPLAAGGVQAGRVAAEVAGTGVRMAASVGISAAPTVQIADELRAAADKMAEAARNLTERLTQRITATEGAAVSTVQGVAAQYARAGRPMAEEDIRRLYERQRGQERLAYDAMVQVAQISGNPLAGAVGAAQRMVDDVYQTVAGVAAGSSSYYDDVREAQEQRRQENRATQGRS